MRGCNATAASPLNEACARAFWKRSFTTGPPLPSSASPRVRITSGKHAVWIQASPRRLVHRAGLGYRILPASEVQPGDRVLPNELKPCRIEVRDNGSFTWEWSTGPTNFWMYDRGDFEENARALREALPALYESFCCPVAR